MFLWLTVLIYAWVSPDVIHRSRCVLALHPCEKWPARTWIRGRRQLFGRGAVCLGRQFRSFQSGIEPWIPPGSVAQPWQTHSDLRPRAGCRVIRMMWLSCFYTQRQARTHVPGRPAPQVNGGDTGRNETSPMIHQEKQPPSNYMFTPICFLVKRRRAHLLPIKPEWLLSLA